MCVQFLIYINITFYKPRIIITYNVCISFHPPFIIIYFQKYELGGFLSFCEVPSIYILILAGVPGDYSSICV